VGLLIAAGIAGYYSGNQPERDAIAFTEEQLGIDLEARRIELDDVTLNVVFAGPEDGKPVVLLHGYPEFWFAWRGPMRELADAGFRVIVPDQRGYNDSDKPSHVEAYRLDRLATDVADLITVLGYSKAYLAGHDFGGLVSWWTLMLYPEKIEKFVIFNKPHPQAILDYADQGESISWYRTFLRIPKLPGYVARLGNWAILSKNLRATSLPETFPEDEMDHYFSAWDNDGAINSMGAWYRANANLPLPRDVAIRVPGRLVLAPEDAFSPKAIGMLSGKFLERGEIVELDGGTHWIIQEKPKLVGQMLIRIFSEE